MNLKTYDMTAVNYVRDMQIDVTALDVEWVEQAELAMRYSSMWVDAKDAVDRVKDELALLKAELTQKINAQPDTFLGKDVKATVANVDAAILMDEGYQELRAEYLDAVRECNLLEIAKNEIAFTRKAALENLVVLHGQQYFAGPKMPRNLFNEVNKRKEKRGAQKKENNERVTIKSRRRRK